MALGQKTGRALTLTLKVYYDLGEDRPGSEQAALKDEEIMKALGRASPFSGFDFDSGERDLGFVYRRPDALGRAIFTLAGIEYVKRVSVL